MDSKAILRKFGLDNLNEGDLEVFTPINGQRLASIRLATVDDVAEAAEKSKEAFKEWLKVPMPVRGEFMRLMGDELRAAKEDLAQLVTLECGKIISEGRGEVQEMIDICDYAVGLSRQPLGKTIPSERGRHELIERWHPIGPVGVISAFNFPVAVALWNAAIAIVAGDPVVWKSSEKTPLVALATQQIILRAAEKFTNQTNTPVPADLFQVLIGGKEIGEAMVSNEAFPVISATGSVPMGKKVAVAVAERLGRSILELGGNNASIVTPSAEINESLLKSIAFGAVGTAGQRCTSLRRLIVHKDVYDQLIPRLVERYKQVAKGEIGNPFNDGVLMGPLIDKVAVANMKKAFLAAVEQGGKILVGNEGDLALPGLEGGNYVRPMMIAMPGQTQIVCDETFAPIMYVLTYSGDIEEAIAINNGVKQGLSSNIYSDSQRECSIFTSPEGSDCGLANINVGTSGAEIGGAFGGEKDTGGGRESGSDSWKQYMRRQTTAVNFSGGVALAQGVQFDTKPEPG